MKRETIGLALAFLWLASSCVSYKKFSVEVYKPADYSISKDAKKIALVSRNLKYTTDTLQHYQVRNHHLIKDKVRFNTDSIAVKICLDSLSAKLIARNMFDSVWVVPVNAIPVLRTNEIRPAKAGWYNTLGEKTSADVLIMLDMFSCFYNQNNEGSGTSANVVTSNIWSIYDVKASKLVDRYSQVDTLYWDSYDENGRYSGIKIPDKINAVSLAAGVIGENYSKHILPDWIKVDRNYLIINQPEFQKAIELAQKDRWDEASIIWQKQLTYSSKQKKIVALYNLALASEMNGDITQAIAFTDEAAKLSSGVFMASLNEAVRKYSVVLHQRRNEINKLNLQNEMH